jgi:protein gp37
MGENSKIAWTDHTFNPWWGCTKIAPECAGCYAEAWPEDLRIREFPEGAQII